MLLPSCTTHQCPYPIPHLYTHTHIRRGTPLHVPANGGGMVRKRSPSSSTVCLVEIACTVPAILRAGPHNIPPHGRHRACGCAIAIVQNGATYGADIVHFRCSWTGKVIKYTHTALKYTHGYYTRPVGTPSPSATTH